MKKIFTFLTAIAIVRFASAQSYHQQDRSYAERNVEHYRNNHYDRDDHDRNYDYRNGNYSSRGYNERQRQEQIDCINRDYDQRINAYQNDRRISKHERERRIYQINTERKQKLQSFGAGASVGAIAGLVLGAILSH
ncbi:MAG: hypothetical protein ABUT20_64490 [Bacteroidota bacterium]